MDKTPYQGVTSSEKKLELSRRSVIIRSYSNSLLTKK